MISASILPTAATLLLLGVLVCPAPAEQTNGAYPIDLRTTLRLAGGQSLDVLLAGERLRLAEAEHEEARLRFFPWIEPAVGYRRHEGNIQDVGGSILDVTKQSYSAGAALNARVELGEAIYGSLATRQLVRAAEQNRETSRQQAALEAAVRYFELARAKAAAGVALEAVRLAREYADQVERAVGVGIAFKGDAQRAAVRAAQARIALRQAEEQREIASARLVQTLRLDPAITLDPQGNDLGRISLVDQDMPLSALLVTALAMRPDLRETEAVTASSEAVFKGAKYGPLIPTLGAQANFYGLGGGRNDAWGSFDDGQDYFVGLRWRIGPGGLLDRSRLRAAESRERLSRLESEKLRDQVTRQVVEARARVLSLADQLELAKRSMELAEQTWALSRDRKEFGVGAVLETIQAEQEYTLARLEYLRAIAGHNAAQFSLGTALGQPVEPHDIKASAERQGAQGAELPLRPLPPGISAGRH